jgi:anti-sigma regulatory factor (Ser/Thr protein kinase)
VTGEDTVPKRVVPPEPRLLRDLRGAVRADLERAGLDSAVVDDAVLCVHEACLNAIQHGTGDVHVRWEVDGGAVAVEVGDRGPGVTLRGLEAPPPPDRQSGRGLFLIGRLADKLETGARGPLRYVAFALGPHPARPAAPSGATGGPAVARSSGVVASVASPRPSW